MKLKSFMMEVFEYLDSHPNSASEDQMVINLMVKYSVTKDFALSLIKEWRKNEQR